MVLLFASIPPLPGSSISFSEEAGSKLVEIGTTLPDTVTKLDTGAYRYCTHIHTYTHICICMYTHTHVHTYTHIHTQALVPIGTVHTYTHTYIHKHWCLQAHCTYIHTYIHTHTYTSTGAYRYCRHTLTQLG